MFVERLWCSVKYLFQTNSIDELYCYVLVFLITNLTRNIMLKTPAQPPLPLFNGELVGYAMNERMTKRLVIQALFRATASKHPDKGLIAHSDRGGQYCAHDYQNLDVYKRQVLGPTFWISLLRHPYGKSERLILMHSMFTMHFGRRVN